MKIIAFDPSSSVIGYAVSENGAIIDAGLIKPTRTKDDAAARVRDMRIVVSVCHRPTADRCGKACRAGI